MINAIDTLHQKGEKKVAEWIRGSSLAWTQPYNTQSMSYGNAQRYRSSGRDDKEAQLGPPDKAQHFCGKRYVI